MIITNLCQSKFVMYFKMNLKNNTLTDMFLNLAVMRWMEWWLSWNAGLVSIFFSYDRYDDLNGFHFRTSNICTL